MKVNTSKMRPYGRIKTVKGSSWKKDIHPPKGHKNWWEDICDPISRSIMKLNFKKENKQSNLDMSKSREMIKQELNL